jgi:plasmid maintenance system antidote protein VapI
MTRPGRYIEAEMKARGWTAHQVAEDSGLSVTTITGILAGRERITPIRAFGLARAFGVSEALFVALQTAFEETTR